MQVKRPNLPPTPSKCVIGSSILPPLSTILTTTGSVPGQFATPEARCKVLPAIGTLSAPGAEHSLHEKRGLGSIYGPFQYHIQSTPHENYKYSHSNTQAMNNISQTPSRELAKLASLPTPAPTSANTSFDASDLEITIKNGEPVAKTRAKLSPTTEAKSYAFISHSPTTFPSQEPSIDNVSLARRKRRRTSPNELSVLNEEFKRGQTPNKARRIEIAEKVMMTEKAVQIWFQNKRQAMRKQLVTEREVTELPIAPPVHDMSTPIKMLHKSSLQIFALSSPSLIQEVKVSASSIAKASNAKFAAKEEVTKSGLVLSETKKKQPDFLNANSMSTMTFRLAPAKTKSTSPLSDISCNTLNKFSQKLASVAQTDDTDVENDSITEGNLVEFKEQISDRRVPLGVINTNTGRGKLSKENEKNCIQNLLSLRSGNWN